MTNAPSYVHGASDVEFIGATIGEYFDGVVKRFPDRDAVVSRHQNVRLTYLELQQAAEEFARGLVALGVAHGDRVGIWSTNNAEWIIAQFATPKIGAILVNVNPAYRTSEVSYALQQSGVSVLLTQVRHKTSEYARMLAEVRNALPALRKIVLIGDDDPGVELDAMRWNDVRALAAGVTPGALAERQERTQPDEAINIQYTSG